MATARINFPVSASFANFSANDVNQRTKVTLRQVDGSFIITLPFAPVEVAHSNIGLNFEERERPSLEPLLLPTAQKLPKMAFELLVVSETERGLASCEHIIAVLVAMASDGLPMVMAYGPLASRFTWIITDLQITSTQRERLTNNIAKAQVQIELTKASPLSVSVVPGMPVILDTYGVITKPSATKSSKTAAKKRTTVKVEDEAAKFRVPTGVANPGVTPFGANGVIIDG
jgi:hypothetical protein